MVEEWPLVGAGVAGNGLLTLLSRTGDKRKTFPSRPPTLLPTPTEWPPLLGHRVVEFQPRSHYCHSSRTQDGYLCRHSQGTPGTCASGTSHCKHYYSTRRRTSRRHLMSLDLLMTSPTDDYRHTRSATVLPRPHPAPLSTTVRGR